MLRDHTVNSVPLMEDFINSKKINMLLLSHKFRDERLSKNPDKRKFNTLKINTFHLSKARCIFAFFFCTNVDI